MTEPREHVIARLKARSKKVALGREIMKRFIIDWINRELEIRGMSPLTRDEEREI
jgi:hypothetical protein